MRLWYNGKSRAHDQMLTAEYLRKRYADPQPDRVCECGWITARSICPICDGIRVGGKA